MKKIILFRHGEKQKIDSVLEDDKRGVHLTVLGVIQINKLAEALLNKFPKLVSSNIIYSSPYTRAIQSAEIIKSKLKIKEMIVFPELGEFSAYNNYQNPKEFRQQLQDMAMRNQDWVSPETHISLNMFISNFQNKLKEICNQTSNDLILVSSHGGIIRNTVYSIDPKTRPSDDLIAEAKIHEAGYTVLNYDGQNFTVEEFDVHDHLVV